VRRVSIIQGEHKVVAEPGVVITTILGSCIAVCLRDPVTRVGGMNHFLLAEPKDDVALSETEMQRYGVHAMELLINEMMKMGAVRTRLRAQVYGGGNVVAGLGGIGSNNAAFAHDFLRTEAIEVAYADVGGKSARKLEFMPWEGKARCKAVTNVVPIAFRAAAAGPVGGDVELF